jgi:hypothetical protein
LSGEAASDELANGFSAEAARLRASGALGESGRLVELFDFFVARGPVAESASQAEIADSVFGQTETDGDDPTVRVYVHRLRKRVEEHYASASASVAEGQLSIPAGTYALRYAQGAPASDNTVTKPDAGRAGLAILAFAPILIAAAFIIGTQFGDGDTAPVNDIWEHFLESERPIMVVVGDYYIYGEIDPVRPDEGRMIRDFRVNSASDLALAQESDPARYGVAEDMGLNYLPMASAYGLQALMPVLSQSDRPVSVMPASQVTRETLSEYNIVYVGLVSGMGLVEDVNFAHAGIRVGESYDELIVNSSNRRYVSSEARTLASPSYYTDYGYLSVFREPGGALIAVVAGARDTGLRGLAPLVAAGDLPSELDRLADSPGGFEAMYEITGQQGADLSEKLVFSGERPVAD